MGKTTRRFLAGLAALAVLPVSGMAMANTANAASGTPDNHKYYPGPGPLYYGTVMWNDYKDSNHSDDLDDLWVTDRKNDGQSIELKVYKGGKLYKKAHAYYGETKKVYLWNVNKGEKVFWTTCLWERGVKGDCENHWSQE